MYKGQRVPGGLSLFARASRPRQALPPPRLATAGDRDWGFGVVVSAFRKAAQERPGVPESAAEAYIVDALLCCRGGAGGRQAAQQGAPEPALLGATDAEMQVGRPSSLPAGPVH